MTNDILSDKYLEMFRGLANLVDEVDTYHGMTKEKGHTDDINKVKANKQSKKERRV